MTTLERRKVGGLLFDVRPGTTDDTVIEEVIRRSCYAKRGFFDIEPGERWLDLGCNIGTFSCWAGARGAKVHGYEPEPENADLARHNLKLNGLPANVDQIAVVERSDGPTRLYLCKGDYNRYRHTLHAVKGRQWIDVPTVDLDTLIAEHRPQGIKLDIEGSELPMLHSQRTWPGVVKLVFEYDFDYDSSIAHFNERMAHLRSLGFELKHRPMPKGKTVYSFWPSGVLVHAVRPPTKAS